MVEGPRISLATARRIAVKAQGLAAPFPRPGPDGVLETARKIRCIQIDPINAVARTQHLVLFSRLGPRYSPEHLDEIAWRRKELFSYWAHAASFVLTEDFPLFTRRMRRWPEDGGTWAAKTAEWMQANAAMKRHIIKRIRAAGPLRSRDLTVEGAIPWSSTGWNAGQDVSRMLEFLWIQGKLMIAGRAGSDRLWDLADRWFPDWTPRQRMTERQTVERATVHALRALGVATQRDINRYFTRGSYLDLKATLERLVKKGDVIPVVVGGSSERWFALAEQEYGLKAATGDAWGPRTTLLSPFDNLIADRARTAKLFDFDYTIEIYVPKAKRRYGYYVLPILHGDKLIGRIDSRMDRDKNVYFVDNVYAEAGAPRDRATGHAVRDAIESLGSWLGADSIRFGRSEAWSTSLR